MTKMIITKENQVLWKGSSDEDEMLRNIQKEISGRHLLVCLLRDLYIYIYIYFLAFLSF